MFTGPGTRAGRGLLVEGGSFTVSPFAIVAVASNFSVQVKRVRALLTNILCTISDGTYVVNVKVVSVSGNSVTMQVQQIVIGSVGKTMRAGAEIWVTGTTYSGAPGSSPYAGKYHPDRPPIGIFADEEYYSDSENLSWAWGIQGTSTITYAANSSYITFDNSGSLRWRYISAPPGGTDFILAAKQSLNSSAGSQRYGIAVLSAGTVSAPTELWTVGIIDAGSFNLQWRWDKWIAANNSGAGASSSGTAANYFAAPIFYTRIVYTASSKNISPYVSFDGLRWTLFGGGTATNHPTAVGIMSWPNSVAGGTLMTNWFRVRTDLSVSLSSPALLVGA